MIKGVNRQVVEVNETNCEYFEKIMFFVKPEYTTLSEGKIRERAGMIAAKAGAVPPTKIRRQRFADLFKIGGSMLAGIVMTLILLAALHT